MDSAFVRPLNFEDTKSSKQLVLDSINSSDQIRIGNMRIADIGTSINLSFQLSVYRNFTTTIPSLNKETLNKRLNYLLKKKYLPIISLDFPYRNVISEKYDKGEVIIQYIDSSYINIKYFGALHYPEIIIAINRFEKFVYNTMKGK